MIKAFYHLSISAALLIGIPVTANTPSGEGGFRSPTEYVQLNHDYADYITRIAQIDARSGFIMFDNGSTWSVMESPFPEFRSNLKTWQVGDMIGFVGRTFGSNPAYTFYNRSRNHRFEVEMEMELPPQEDYPKFMAVDMVDTNDIEEGVMVRLSNNLTWRLPLDYASEMAQWNSGDAVMLDVVEELEFESGVLMIKEKMLMVNLTQHKHLQFQDNERMHDVDFFIP